MLAGDIVQIIAVKAFPPKEWDKILVNFESRYGIKRLKIKININKYIYSILLYIKLNIYM